MKVKNPTTGNWDKITLGGGVTIDNSLESDSTTHGASVHAVNVGLSGKISGDGSVEKIVRSETAPTGTEATIWIEPSDFNSAEVTILKDTLEDEDLDKAPTVHAVKQAIDNVENIDYDSIPSQGRIEYTGPTYTTPTGYTKTQIPYDLNTLGGTVSRLDDQMNYPKPYPNYDEEKIIGYWYNGKPIYRRVCTGTSIANFDTGARNIDEVIKMDFLVKQSGANYPDWRNVPWLFSSNDTTYGSAAWAGGFYFRGSTGYVYPQMGSSLKNISKFIFILEYTKTTDSAVELSEVQ